MSSAPLKDYEITVHLSCLSWDLSMLYIYHIRTEVQTRIDEQITDDFTNNNSA